MNGIVGKYQRSENLCNAELEQGSITGLGVDVDRNDRVRTHGYIDLSSGTYTFSFSTTSTALVYAFVYDSTESFVERIPADWTDVPYTFTINSNRKIRFVIKYSDDASISPANVRNLMLNEGSTALPYEPYGNTWHDIPYTKLETATDTLSALPVTTYNDGTSATVATKGNMVQSATPTPSSPITPSECGDMTENMFDKANLVTNGNKVRCTAVENSTGFTLTSTASGDCYIGTTGKAPAVATTAMINQSFVVKANTQYTLHLSSSPWCFIAYIAENGDFLNSDYINLPVRREPMDYNFTTPENCKYVLFRIGMGVVDEGVTLAFTDVMLNEGSTAKPYEPYGYKLPIISGGVTTNVYLGSTQTVRAIKKVVLTGDESFSYDSTNKYYSRTGYGNGVNYLGVCTHYVFRSTNTEGDAYIAPWGAMRIYDSSYSGDVTQFKTWLAVQYANGTPVTFYYVLATETTGIVNEPIRKIGDYADSVSVANIPTTTGGQTFDVDTTLKPSEVALTYHGWHEHEAEKRENGSWT